MTRSGVSTRPLLLVIAALLAGLASGCGQQGPLVLPERAQPIERLETPPAEAEPSEDERQDER
jgi:predicted small lipoprotein YifL